MEAARQVTLLLRRNFTLRLRQPIILALEVLWPVLIFLVVMAARNAIPPVSQPTCYYKAWALPSAGVVPFVQSMICNIDECQNATEYEDIPSYAGSSVQELVAHTVPLISDKSITELVSALPKGMRLLRVAVDALSGPDLSALLEDGFPVRNLLKDANETKEQLQRINMTNQEIDLIFDSSVQLPQMLEIMSGKNFCEGFTNADSSSSDAFETLRKRLCSANNASRKDFFRHLKNHLDVKNIVQTMGLAMSELGRLDVSEILENIAGLLTSFQSSDILSADILTMVSTLLGEIHFRKIDTEVLSLLIDDLEPLYRHSQWSGLINILKDIKFPTADETAAETLDGEKAEKYKSEAHGIDEKRIMSRSDDSNPSISSSNKNSTNILENVLEIAGTGVDVLRLIPEQDSRMKIQGFFKYVSLLVDFADEITKSLEKDDSTIFIDKLSTILSGVFLNIAERSEQSNSSANFESQRKNCKSEDSLNGMHSPQDYACMLYKALHSSKDEENGWHTIADKLKRILSSNTGYRVGNNLQKWKSQTKANGNEAAGDIASSRASLLNESNVDDYIAAFECGIQRLTEISHKTDSLNETSANNTSLSPVAAEPLSRQSQNKSEEWILTVVSQSKEVLKELVRNFLSNETTVSYNKIIENELKKILEGNSTSGKHTPGIEILKLLPALLWTANDFNSSYASLTKLSDVVSTGVGDMERMIWKSMSPQMVRKFSVSNESKNFCISEDAEGISDAIRSFMKCSKDTSSFKLFPPKYQKENTHLRSELYSKKSGFGSSDFSRILLQLSSDSGFAVRIAMQLLKPASGCEATCGSKNIMLKKMCFLSRLQSVKDAIDSTATKEEESEISNAPNDILKELQNFLTVDEKIASSYNLFMDSVQISAMNNYTDSKDIVRLVISGIRFLESFGGEEHKLRPPFHVINSLISLLKNRVMDAAQYNETSVVEIEDVFPGSPLTQQVIISLLPLSPEITSTFFWTSLAPEKFLNLVDRSEKNVSVVMSKLCNSSLTRYLYNPSLNKSGFELLGHEICKHRYYDVFEEIFQDPDIQEIVFEAGNTDEISWEDMQDNILEIVTLLKGLSTIRKADFSSLPPLQKWQHMAMDIHARIQDPAVILYITNNKIFHGFCKQNYRQLPAHFKQFFSKEDEEVLFKELCSISKEAFARRLVSNFNNTVRSSFSDTSSTKQKTDYSEAALKLWKSFIETPEIKRITKKMFDLNFSETNGLNSNSESKQWNQRVINATKRAFDYIDAATGGGFSSIVLSTSIPELATNFASLASKSRGSKNFGDFIENGIQVLLAEMLQNSAEKKRLQDYVESLVEYFSKEKRFNDLKILCRTYKQLNVHYRTSSTQQIICSQNPSAWSADEFLRQANVTDVWSQVDGLLDEKAKNATRELYFQKRKLQFLTSVHGIVSSGINFPDLSKVQTSSFYFSIMKAFIRNLDELSKAERGQNSHSSILQRLSCLPESIKSAVTHSTQRLLISIPNAEFATCGLLGKNMSAFYSWFSKSANLKYSIQKISNGMNNEEPCSHSWNWLLAIIDDFEVFYNRLSQNLSEKTSEHIKQCLGNFTQSPLISGLQIHTKMLKQATKFLSTVSASTGQWKETRQQIVLKISQHLPAFLKVSDVLRNGTLFPRILDYGNPYGDLMEFVGDSSINFNWLLRHGFSSAALRKHVCENRHLERRTTPITRFLDMDYFCRNGTLERLIQHFDQEQIKRKVSEVQRREFFSGEWLRQLIASSDVLLKVAEHLTSSLKEISIHNIFDVLQLLTKPHIIRNVADSLGKLAQVLDPVFAGSSLTDTSQQVLDGLNAFKSLTHLADFSFEYPVKDVFGQKALYVLMKELGMNSERAIMLLNSTVDLKESTMNKDAKKVSFCEDSADRTPLCVLSLNEETAVSIEHLQDLLLQRFLYSFGSLGVEGVLRAAEVDSTEAGRTLNVLSSAPEVVSKLTNHLMTVTSIMNPEVKELFQKLNQGAEWLATSDALSIGGQILCGKPLTSLSRKFSLLAPEDTGNKIEEKELLRLPTDFCRYGYKEIMKMRGGAILWGFLKPLFRGKILYSPKNYPPALAIISKVNETLRILEDQVYFVKAAAEGSTGLHYVQRKNETLLSLQKFLASKAVSKLFGSPSWGAALSWLDSSNSSSRSLLRLVELVGNVTQCISLDRFLGFDTEAELEAAAATLHDRREFIAAIVFLEENHTESRLKRWTRRRYLPENILYKIRMDIDNVPTTEYIKYRWWRPYPYDDFFEDLRYFRGFIQLQDTVDTAITELQTSSRRPPTVKKYLQQFPYPCHQRDKFGTLLKGSMPAVMTISWVFIVAFLVRERVLDRELELDETLRVMGLKDGAGWLAWFLSGLNVLLVSVVGIVVVLKWGGITPHSNPLILFLFVADFAILLIAYCQLMSAFFGRASTAALMSVLLYVLSFFPFLLFVTWELDFLYWQKLLSCVLVSTSFCFGCLYLNRYEDQGQGVQWSNLWHSPVAEDGMNFGTTLVAMSLCSLGYFFISWYVSRVWTGNKERRPLGWYFLFMKHSLGDRTNMVGDDCKEKGMFRDGSCKSDKSELKRTVGISAKNVHALYSKRGCKEWKALCGLNLDFYEDRITALLGHNGAGKTTTIKILTGRILPTAGSVTVCGFPVPEKIAEARKHIGFCPQNNTLYDKLTVREHLQLFARLKGLLTNKDLEEDVEIMLERLNLMEKADEPSETLSGGQRRRLCVAIAFVGGSKVVILDEPTSSVDPVARRSIWDLILSYKTGRTILLTTHHLDEADILSDTVAILHKGRLLCCGSPLYLKGRFGSGYRLSLFHGAEKSDREDRDSGHASSESEEPVIVDSDGVMEFIQGYVPDATLLENDENHLVVSLPAEPLTVKPLSEFFGHLHRSLHCWGFQSLSLSSATLDEVFLTLCRLEDAKAAHNSERSLDSLPFTLKSPDTTSNNLKEEIHKDPITTLTIEKQGTNSNCSQGKLSLKYNQMKSLIKKRYWNTRKNWKALLSSILMPCLFIALAMGLAVGKPQKRPDPSIELTPSLYSSDDNKAVSFFTMDNPMNDVGLTLLKTLNANASSFKTCALDHSRCGNRNGAKFNTTEKDSGKMRCLCEEECPTAPLKPLSFISTPSQILYNMSDINISKYLLDTYLQFNEKRYGGWSINRENLSDTAAKVWFENSGYHAAPSYLNTLNNALLKKASHQNLSIRTWSHPLRLSVEQLGRETLLQRLGEVGIAVVFLIGLSLIPSTFAIYVVGERESEQKRLQMVTGAVGPVLYWGAAMLWDLTIVLVTSILSAAIVGAFALPAFYNRENFRAVYSLVVLYGWATTPLTYLCTGFFREGSLAFMVIFTSHLFVGLVIMMALVSLRMISISKDVAVTLELLQRVSLAFPQYSLIGGLTDLNENQIRTEIFAQFGQDVYVSPFSWGLLGPNYIALFVQGLLFFLLTLFLEIIPIKHWCQRLLTSRPQPTREPVLDDTGKSLLQIQNVSQIYPSKAGNKYAVDDLTLTIPDGECFGLVGANGAGKTTLFRLLIGEIRPTSGKILRVGLRTKEIPDHRFLGYCPQKDALDGLLTPRQHLEVYAGLRGIPASQIPKVVECSLQSMELTAHADRPVQTLSGGTKRKLCTAIATMGDPQLILLDEPTSGMDPGTRRLVWRSISRATEAGRSVVLTSHSIEDCDILSTRLGIMVNGRIACLDTPAKLKARYGTGYTMSFRIPEGGQDWTSLIKFIRKVMSSAEVQIRSARRIEMSLPDENLTLPNLFCHLEECAQQFGIEDLAIDPTTLDQVFVNFIRQQSDAIQRNKNDSESKDISSLDENFEICCTKL